MTHGFTYLADLAAVASPPEGGSLCRTAYEDEQVKVMVLGFGAGEEHAGVPTPHPAMLQVVRGEAMFLLGRERTVAAKPGAWVHVPAGLTHSVRALSPLTLVMVQLRPGLA
jgi:quercetin dioxygenase-like cupin family protein